MNEYRMLIDPKTGLGVRSYPNMFFSIYFFYEYLKFEEKSNLKKNHCRVAIPTDYPKPVLGSISKHHIFIPDINYGWHECFIWFQNGALY